MFCGKTIVPSGLTDPQLSFNFTVRAYFSGVNYYDEIADNANLLIDLLRGMHNIAFWKRNSYAYQQEGRFVFVAENNTDDHITLDIGDIRDISLVFPSEQVLTGVITRK